MDTARDIVEDRPAIGEAECTPFSQVLVRLTKQAYIQLAWDAGYWKTAYQRAMGRLRELEDRHRRETDQAAEREAALRGELAAAQARIRDLQKRAFGRKSEQSSRTDQAPTSNVPSSRSRGQPAGATGHGRTMHGHLPAHSETIEIDSPQCPSCGLRIVHRYIGYIGVSSNITTCCYGVQFPEVNEVRFDRSGRQRFSG